MDGAGELEKIYREDATRIRALAARLGDVGLAEDLVQDDLAPCHLARVLLRGHPAPAMPTLRDRYGAKGSE